MFKKFKTIATALLNIPELVKTQEDLVQTKEQLALQKQELASLNLDKANVMKEIANLREHKKIATLSDEEITEITNKNIKENVAYFIQDFNKEINKNVAQGNMAFRLSYEVSTDSDRKAIDFVCEKFRKEGVSITKNKPVFHDTGGWGGWVTYFSIDVSKKYNSGLNKPKF